MWLLWVAIESAKKAPEPSMQHNSRRLHGKGDNRGNKIFYTHRQSLTSVFVAFKTKNYKFCFMDTFSHK